jgi:hypothetical protein
MEFEVGKPFPLYRKSIVDHPEGAVLDVTKEGDYFLNIFLEEMRPQEIDAINRGSIEFRIFSEDSTGFLLTLVRIGGKAFTFEIIFDPTLYENRKPDIELYKRSNALNICAIDKGILKCLRLVTIPDKLSQRWIYSWSKMLQMENCNEHYMNWVFHLYRFTLNQLWDYSMMAAKIQRNQ